MDVARSYEIFNKCIWVWVRADIGISPIFIIDLYPYRGDTTGVSKDIKEQTKTWKKQFPTVRSLDIDKVLDRRVVKRTRKKEYFEYANTSYILFTLSYN